MIAAGEVATGHSLPNSWSPGRDEDNDAPVGCHGNRLVTMLGALMRFEDALHNTWTAEDTGCHRLSLHHRRIKTTTQVNIT